MKKRFLAAVLCGAMAVSLLAGCGSSSSSSSSTTEAAEETEEAAEETEEASDDAEEAAAPAEASGSYEGKTFAIVPKSAGNPYNEKEVEGFTEIIEANGGTVVVNYPESATADAQITVINSLISQGVDSIAVAANDANALSAVMQDAMAEGIQVSTLDSDVTPESRAAFANQAGVTEVAQALCDAVYDIAGGEGQWAIVSASSQATNQNAWIDAMKEIMADDSKYADLELVDIQYGDDEPELSTTVTQALLTNYPDLKVICAPTTVGIAAAAKVLQDAGSACKLTGLGLPSEMANYIGADDAHSCPYMFLWNPIDLGKLSAYISMNLVDGTITGAEGDTFEAPDLDITYTVGEDGNVILGAPFAFTPDNIDEWKEIY